MTTRKCGILASHDARRVHREIINSVTMKINRGKWKAPGYIVLLYARNSLRTGRRFNRSLSFAILSLGAGGERSAICILMIHVNVFVISVSRSRARARFHFTRNAVFRNGDVIRRREANFIP